MELTKHRHVEELIARHGQPEGIDECEEPFSRGPSNTARIMARATPISAGLRRSSVPCSMAFKASRATASSARSQMKAEDWLTVQYVADHLAVTRQQVYRWMRAGHFGDTLKLGRRARRISRDGYRGFVEMRKSA